MKIIIVMMVCCVYSFANECFDNQKNKDNYEKRALKKEKVLKTDGTIIIGFKNQNYDISDLEKSLDISFVKWVNKNSNHALFKINSVKNTTSIFDSLGVDKSIKFAVPNKKGRRILK